jgi:hypothetical protein
MHVSGKGVSDMVDAPRALRFIRLPPLKDDFSVLDAFVACASRGVIGTLDNQQHDRTEFDSWFL